MRQRAVATALLATSQLLIPAALMARDAFANRSADGKTVVVCMDEAETPPQSLQTADGQIKGIYPDLARVPLEELGYKVQFRRLPWRRCVDHELKSGAADAALSAAWTKERAAYAWFPAGAEVDGPKCQSPSALICNGPALLVPSASAYKFDGNRAGIPQPVRVTFGYTQVDELRQRGITVDEGPNDFANVGKMLRDGTGSALVWSTAVQVLAAKAETKGRFRSVDGYNELSDGFLPFSKAGRLSKAEAERVWQAMASHRKNPEYERQIVASYAEPVAASATRSQGALVLCGGAIDLDAKSPTFMADFAPTLTALAGKADAASKLKLAAVMSGSPSKADALEAWQGSADDVGYDQLFSRLGFLPSLIPLIYDAYAAADLTPDWLKTIAASDIVFLNGGDQARHYRALQRDDGEDSLVMKNIRALLARGGVLVGTSAGTHVAGNPMFGNGQSKGYLDASDVYPLTQREQLPSRGKSPMIEHPRNESTGAFGKGLGLWDQILLDSHSSARGRLGRMIVALAASHQSPAFKSVNVAVGVDENTCAVWDIGARKGKVIGRQGVWIADIGSAKVNRVAGQRFRASDIELSYLMAGDTFTLTPAGRVGVITTDIKGHHDKSVRPWEPFAGDIFAEGQTTRAIQSFVSGDLTRMDAQTPGHKLVWRRSADTRLYWGPGAAQKFTVDRLRFDINAD